MRQLLQAVPRPRAQLMPVPASVLISPESAPRVVDDYPKTPLTPTLRRVPAQLQLGACTYDNPALKPLRVRQGQCTGDWQTRAALSSAVQQQQPQRCRQ